MLWISSQNFHQEGADYTEEDIKNIKKFLQSELDKALAAFTPANETAKKTFVLKA